MKEMTQVDVECSEESIAQGLHTLQGTVHTCRLTQEPGVTHGRPGCTGPRRGTTGGQVLGLQRLPRRPRTGRRCSCLQPRPPPFYHPLSVVTELFQYNSGTTSNPSGTPLPPHHPQRVVSEGFRAKIMVQSSDIAAEIS